MPIVSPQNLVYVLIIILFLDFKAFPRLYIDQSAIQWQAGFVIAKDKSSMQSYITDLSLEAPDLSSASKRNRHDCA